jgi:hypothetical protein
MGHAEISLRDENRPSLSLGAVLVNGSLSNSQAVAIGGNLTVSGALTLPSQHSTVAGNLRMGANVTGNVSVGGTLFLAYDATSTATAAHTVRY